MVACPSSVDDACLTCRELPLPAQRPHNAVLRIEVAQGAGLCYQSLDVLQWDPPIQPLGRLVVRVAAATPCVELKASSLPIRGPSAVKFRPVVQSTALEGIWWPTPAGHTHSLKARNRCKADTCRQQMSVTKWVDIRPEAGPPAEPVDQSGDAPCRIAFQGGVHRAADTGRS